jgi:mono/diheme cytochrome c family protein
MTPIPLAVLLLAGGIAPGVLAQGSGTATAVDGASGKRLVEWKCNACHRSDRATEIRKTRAEWEKTVARMVENGLLAEDEELKQIVQYLASFNDPASDAAGGP